jgi:hypothetical protein
MDNVACNVIYVDRSVSRDRHVVAGESSTVADAVQGEPAHVAANLESLLTVFDEGMRSWPAAQRGSFSLLAVMPSSHVPVANRRM